MIKAGQCFDDIANAEGVSKLRIQTVIELALLSPATLEMISMGKQNTGLTADYLVKKGFSELWSEQQKQFAGL